MTTITWIDGKQYDVSPVTATTTPTTTTTTPTATTTTPTTTTTVPAFPDATTTGVPAGKTLVASGNIVVTVDGTIIDGKMVTGSGDGYCIEVKANNVTIQNCKITGRGMDSGIYLDPPYKGLKVLHCEIYGTPAVGETSAANRLTEELVNGIRTDDVMTGSASEIAYCNIHGVSNAICSVDSYIHDNYIHDFADWTFAVSGGTDDMHTDGVQTYDAGGIGGMKIVHNTIMGISTMGMWSPTHYTGTSSCVAMSLNQHDVTIDNNLMAGGSYTIYGPSQSSPSTTPNIKITNNHFSTKYYPKCGAYGIFDGFNPSASGWVFSGNVIHETGAPVTINS